MKDIFQVISFFVFTRTYVSGFFHFRNTIFTRIQKRLSSPVLDSVMVNLTGNSVCAWVVLFQSIKQKPQCLTLLDVDQLLSEGKVITFYEKCWDIETFFKIIKSFLKLAKEFEVRFYDNLIIHTSVFIRSIMLVVMSWKNDNSRIFGRFFYAYYDEIQIIALKKTVTSILKLIQPTLKNILVLSKEKVIGLFFRYLKNYPAWLRDKTLLLNCKC